MLASKRKKDESQALFTFSPFGLSCRRCENNVSIQIDARSIQIHLKKHGLDSRAFLVRTLVDGFMSQVLNAKASGSIEPYKSDSNTYMGFSCICGRVFQLRKDSALRHCKKQVATLRGRGSK
jgi:hypothetical protein